MAHDILIVDDESDICDLVSGILGDEGYETRVATTSGAAMAEIQSRFPSLLILDIWLQGSDIDGLALLDRVLADDPDLPVIMISGHGNIETAVAAIKAGAYDFIEKPFKADRLLTMIQRAVESSKLRRENREMRLRGSPETELIGSSPAINALRAAVEKVAPTGSRVLISGAPGSGKEVVARMLHAMSRQAEGPMVVVNAAAMAPDRMEVELFGTEKGASDSADGRKLGTFEQAHGGTLFLDNVADMPLETQAKILRVLQDQNFERVGGSTKIQVDVRVISASSRDLSEEISDGRFREDLYHRLNVVPVRVPALRERREDIPQLAHYFSRRTAEATGLPPRRIDEDALAVLQAYDWPGNVRELRNLIERIMILAPGDADGIRASMLPPELGAGTIATVRPAGGEDIMALALREAREVFEREYLTAQITRFGGNVSRTASFVGMERSALHRKLKALGVNNDRGTGLIS
ncbi:MAG: sigma-54-dependent Fis family transcriptional regulator [Alphaproteobacteria bacterium]|jgi:two-component system, NtrC family, nitrogen regulation response regulator NtrX|nr:sigma-54-dependent Fis family transcriptional regulator [Alphaproteobacteria bacterium]